MTNKFIYLTVAAVGLSLGACASTEKQLLAECGADEACLERIAEQRDETRRRQMQTYLESQDRMRAEQTYNYTRDSSDAARKNQSKE